LRPNRITVIGTSSFAGGGLLGGTGWVWPALCCFCATIIDGCDLSHGSVPRVGVRKKLDITTDKTHVAILRREEPTYRQNPSGHYATLAEFARWLRGRRRHQLLLARTSFGFATSGGPPVTFKAGAQRLLAGWRR
jgi:hypothetical protein